MSSWNLAICALVRKGGLEPSRQPDLQELPMILKLRTLQNLTKSME